MKIAKEYLRELIKEETAVLIKEYGFFGKEPMPKTRRQDEIGPENRRVRWTEAQISELFSRLKTIEGKIDERSRQDPDPGEGDPSSGRDLPPPGHPSYESDPP